MERKHSTQHERRSITMNELRVSGDDGDEPVIEGYASVFDKWSQELGGMFPFREKVMRGAFSESIGKDDIRALFNHNPDFVLGRNKSGTLHMHEDENGLKVRITPPKTTWAKDLMTSISRGDITQMSFGFLVEKDKWIVSSADEVDTRELHKVKLFDVSPVTFPAYLDTEVGIRSTLALYEAQLKEAHDSREKAKQHARLKLQKIKLENE